MKTKVALVDDHELLKSGLVGIINSLGHFKVIFKAENGIEFKKKIDKHNPPDIVMQGIAKIHE